MQSNTTNTPSTNTDVYSLLVGVLEHADNAIDLCNDEESGIDFEIYAVRDNAIEGIAAVKALQKKAALFEHRLAGHEITTPVGLMDFALLAIDRANATLSLLSLTCTSFEKIESKTLIPLLAAMEHDLMDAQLAIEIAQTGEKPTKTKNPD